MEEVTDFKRGIMRHRFLLKSKIICIFFLFLFSHFTTISPKICISPTTKETVVEILRTLDQYRYSIGEIVTGPMTLRTAGCYVLGNNINGAIIIAADDVWFDLNNFCVHENTGVTDAIVVEADHKNVSITNGAVKGSSGFSGIVISEGVELVKIEKLQVFNFTKGIDFDGSPDAKVKACKVKDCTISGCSVGVSGNYLFKSTFENVEVKNCLHSGFGFFSSKWNVFDRCNVVSIEDNDNTFGFSSTGGQGNLFRECFAENIMTTTSTATKGAFGFLLSGDRESKIIDCLANTINMGGVGDAYGINLGEIDFALSAANFGSGPATSYAVDISPGGDYVVVGGEPTTEGFEIKVFAFDGSNFTQVTTASHGNTIRSVKWHPTDDYIAVGGLMAGDGKVVRVYDFSMSTLQEVASTGTATIETTYSVDWHPTGDYLATGGQTNGDPSTGSGGAGEIAVFGFDGSSLLTVTSADHGTGDVEEDFSVDFNSTGSYLAVGGASASDGNEVRVYSFNGSTLTNLPGSEVSIDDGTIYAVQWSHFGNYLAAGGVESTSPKTELRIFSFDGASLTEIASDDHGDAGTIYSLDWSATDTFLVVGGDTSDIDSKEIRVFEFDPSQTVTANRLIDIAQGDHGTFSEEEVRSVIWANSESAVISAGRTALGQTDDDDEIRLFSFGGASLTEVSSADYGKRFITAFSVDWNPNTKFLAAGGPGDVETFKEIKIYSFDGLFLSLFATADFGSHAPLTAQVNAVNWSPEGDYLAAGGKCAADGDLVRVYSFDGSILQEVATTGTNNLTCINFVDWHHSGTLLAVGGLTAADEREVWVYGFDGSNLSEVASANHGTGSDEEVLSVQWHPTGNYLAIGGVTASDGVEIRVYSFDGSTLTSLPGAQIGINFGSIQSVKWSPSGNYLVVGGVELLTPFKEIRVFSFDGSTLTEVATADHGSVGYVFGVDWLEGTSKIVSCGFTADSDSKEIRLFDFDGSSLTQLKTYEYDTVYSDVRSVDLLSPGIIAVSGLSDSQDNEIQLFSLLGSFSCKVENNNVSNVSGTGLSGDSSANLIIKNICYECDTSFGSGVTNSYAGGLTGYPTNIVNIGVPPYEEAVDKALLENKIKIIDAKARQLYAKVCLIGDLLVDPESKIDESIACCKTVESKLDFVDANLLIVESKIDLSQEFCIASNSKIDVADEKLETVESKVDDIQVCCYTVDSKVDQFENVLEAVDSKVDQYDLCCSIVSSKLDVIESKVDLIDIIGERITTSTVITSPGFYFVTNSIDGTIVIDSDTVYLDLNGAEVYDSSVTNTLITVSADHTNIVIKNGFVHDGSDGIVVEQGASLVQIQDVHVTDCQNGIHFDGATTGTISCCIVTDCLFASNEKGVFANYLEKGSFENCNACNCTIAGFELNNSQFNLFKKCKALRIENDTETQSATGFSSTSGLGNIFIECVADGIEKTASNFCNKATGFLFNGTDTTDGET